MTRNRSFRFLSWNVRGLNGHDKCCVVRSVVRHSKCGVICLQESKLASTSYRKFLSFCGGHIRDYRTLDAVGTRGGLLSAWNPSLFDCCRELVGEFSLNIVLSRKVDGTTFTISNIYGPTCASRKEAFFRELRTLGGSIVGAWVLMGDFNQLLSVQDKNGPPARVAGMLAFKSVVNYLGVLDFPLCNKSFTWTNGRPSPTLERLDRALISRAWQASFPRSTLRALPRPRSDHSPLVLTAFSFIPSPFLFRFERFWLRHPAINEVIGKAWRAVPRADSIAAGFAAKIARVTTDLKAWGRGLTSTLKVQADCCLLWISWLDRAEEVRVLVTREGILRTRLKLRFEELCIQEELKWKQRSRVHWLKAGDANTKFFHHYANARRSKNFIARLTDGLSIYSDHVAMANLLFRFFRNQSGMVSGSVKSIDLPLLYVNEGVDLASLQEPFSLQEIRRAVFSSPPDKAPGPDGLPLLFYQRFWGTIKEDILEVFHNLYRGQLDLRELNRGWICLIPKKVVAAEVRDYRPICLLNGLTKIISKVLASRLQCFLNVLINPCQTAFIKGRTLMDNFLSAHFLTHHLFSTKQQAALFKIDFERAFDLINWDFLIEVLQTRRCGSKWISWIQGILQSSSNAVLLNGVPCEFFQCRRGIRQGDPLSPLLFILGIDVLFRMLQRAVSYSLLPTMGIGDVSIHTLQFADDILLFFDGSTRSAVIIKWILDAFSAASGLTINFNKSRLIPINLEDSQASRLARIFGCATDGFPFTYLGLSLSPRALRKVDYMPLIEKIDRRLAGWKGLLLSRAGRLVLLNSAISSVPIFFCSAFKIPEWVFKAIDRIRRGFFWQGKAQCSGFQCLVKWEQLCRPRGVGGLGICNLRATNSALLMKNLWNMYNANSLPWVRLLRHKHYKRRLLGAGGAQPARCSPIWKGILSASAPFHASVTFNIGDGRTASFWHARWEGETALRNRFPALFAASTSKFISVKGWMSRFACRRNLGFNRGADLDAAGQRAVEQLELVITNVALNNSPDTVVWRWTSNGKFEVRSAYNLLVFDGIDDRRIRHLWDIKIPLRIKIFLWLAARNRIPTTDCLTKRGWQGPSVCGLCGREEECLEHLFFKCVYARNVWNRVFQDNLQLCNILLSRPGDLATRWIRTKKTCGGRVRHFIDIGIAAACWEIWLERNRRIFDSKLIGAGECGSRTISTMAVWKVAWG